MKHSNRIFALCLLVWAILVGTSVSAQVVYSCDFENTAENARWHLNPMANSAKAQAWPDKWYIGTADNAGGTGTHSLYISNDNAVSNAYSSTVTRSMVAYRDSIAVQANQTYTLFFDYKAAGKSSGSDVLTVAWVPLPTPTAIKSFNSTLTSTPGTYAQAPYVIATLRGEPNWKSFSGTFTPTTAQGKLIFVWSNAAGTAVNPPAAVDNIEIVRGTCPEPTNLTYVTTGGVRWSGNADAYDVRFYNPLANVWGEENNVTGNSVALPTLTEGYTIFYVRSRCSGGTHSAWVSIGQFIFIKGARCIDFLDLDAASCYTGSAQSTNYNAWQVLGKVDNGYAAATSQHTIHYVPGETDPRTNDELPTIPSGEIASVRLGNWNASYGAEGIQYKLKVQAGASDILKLRYACVLENGGHTAGGPESGTHGSNEQSHFYVEIRDELNRPQDPGCSTFDFSCDPNAPATDGWHKNGSVMWKEWTEVSISLVKYIGKTITIRLATYDCTAAGHYGYAYFCMNCESGSMEGISCNDYSTDHFTAPPGFNYKWYKKYDKLETTVSTDQRLDISTTDTTIYLVDVINKVTNCKYTLTANPNPRYPAALVNYKAKTIDCENVIDFVNSSHVVYVNRQDGAYSDSEEAVESLIWDFGDGSPEEENLDSVFTHTYPQAGGKYNVKVVASMSNGICTDTLVIPLDLPALGDKRAANSYKRCQGDKYTFMGKDYYDDFVDSVVVTSLATGCDSTSVVSVHFIDKSEYAYKDTICSDYGTYNFHGQDLLKTGTYTATLQNYLGCDSVVTLNLQVYPALEIRVDSAFARCADDNDPLTIPYLVNEGKADSVFIYMDNEALAAGFEPVYRFSVDEPILITWDKTIRPNIYQGVVVFTSQWCTTRSYPIRIELDYPSSTLDQKNGIVAVLNDGYNGGYPLSSYQWYRNGEKIEGATGSYLNVSDEDMNAEYYAIVYRSDDNVVLPTCPIVYTGGGWRSGIADDKAALQAYPTLVRPGETIHVLSSETLTITDMLGRTVASYAASVLPVNSIPAPSIPGLYIINTSSEKNVRILVQ